METNLANIRVEALEPLSELLVVVRIFDQHVSSVEDDVHALPIGKAFKEGSKLRSGSFQTMILHNEQNNHEYFKLAMCK